MKTNSVTTEANILKGSTKISISVSELRQLLAARDSASELVDALTRVEQTSQLPDAAQYSHSATRRIIERLGHKAESLKRQRDARRERKDRLAKAKSIMADAKPAVEAELPPSLFTQSDVVKIRQIMRRRDGIKKNLLALISTIADRTQSSALALVARSIEVALDFVGQVHTDINIITTTGRQRTASFTIPTLRHLIAPLVPEIAG